ncbi:uncharacterized protein LOC128331412 isoform X2 [Hemicordylus capensis]|uniref:uncharacterized protein LOC128331412 isoform X2 n=1 Tax=Hemicordylus capensis TaxID=884348 RepID=UPI002303F6AA|nr:uncharacterized protein LOC128331412 isoform X2 [Hemicordylus capensis]
MDVTLLVPMLVLLHVVLQPGSNEEALRPPRLSIHPQQLEYFEGEKVELICSADSHSAVEGYRFFNKSGGPISTVPTIPFQEGRLILRVQMESTGDYSCDYWIGNGSGGATSARSNAISLRVKEAPAAPFLSLNPSLPEYNWGDDVSLVCSAPLETKKVSEFQYYGERVAISAVASSYIHTYNLSIMEIKHVGLYRCAYVVYLDGRPVVSKQSQPVSIAVTSTDVARQWVRMLAVGCSFFTINGLIFLISHCLF